MSYDYQNCLNYAVETAVEAAVKTATEKALSEGKAKGKAEGLSEGEAKKSLEIAKKMLVMGLSTEQIAQATGLSEEEVIKLNHYTNLQLLKAKDNLQKRDKLDWRI